MGGHPSKEPRTVTFENDENDGIIELSEAVVQRLKNQKAEMDGNRKQQQQRSQQQGQQQQQQKSSGDSGSAGGDLIFTPPPPLPVQQPTSSAKGRGAPAFLHYAEPSLTAMQVRTEKEAELRANDEYWRKRLQQTEINLKQTNAVMEKEYNETINNVKKLFETAPSTFKPAPCETYRARLIACYKAFPGQTLECTKEVADFTACVDQNRVDFLDSKYKAGAGAAQKPTAAK